MKFIRLIIFSIIANFIITTNASYAKPLNKNSSKILQNLESKKINSSQANDASVFNRIQNYLKSLNDVLIPFSQKSQEGSADGALIMSKKFGLRCNYFAPYPLNIILYKSNVGIYDYDLNSLIKDQIQNELWQFLLTGEISSDVQIIKTDIFDNHESILIFKDDSFKAKIIFETKPHYRLSSIEIFESNFDNDLNDKNNKNDNLFLYFENPRHITNLNKNLFIFRDPKAFGHQKRYNMKELEKNFKYVE